MSSKRYKVTYADGRPFSLGYPSKGAAGAAAARLNEGNPSKHIRFKVAEMTPNDYRIMEELEKL